MPEVVFIYDDDCPNAQDCRANLIKAFVASGKKPSWREINRSWEGAPAHLRGYGSPTVLVNGTDVANQEPREIGPACRLYLDDDGRCVGAPSVARIAASLTGEPPEKTPLVGASTFHGGWKKSLAVLPALGAALIPGISCPACWPGYAAVLSSLGIGFLPSNRYLLPLTVTLLAVYLFMLAWDARKRGGFGLLLVGAVGSTILLMGRFGSGSTALFAAGIALLIVVAVGNAWPAIKTKWLTRTQKTKGGCSACQSAADSHGVDRWEKA